MQVSVVRPSAFFPKVRHEKNTDKTGEDDERWSTEFRRELLDGSLFYEAAASGALTDAKKHWWAQAEAVVGFYNAFQISGDGRFAAASRRAWDYIETHVVDRRFGEWHAKLSPDGRPLTPEEDGDACLAGPWKCPYHNSRACFEMLERLK
jgi:cellobiose epimerase